MAHGRYTIVGKLADGGMAEIFLARQHGAEGFQKPVVMKRVLSAFSADPQFRNMFLDEAHISMGLAHGNIVQVLDVGVAGDRTFLVLELVEGWDLDQIMERAQATGPDHPWPPSLALYVTAQICRALAYAHAKRGPDGRPLGIVHRDVSPTNVLISEQGEVKLADFGIAKAERKREQTLAGVIKGKIGFMSPEQALGRPLDARADLFSVGTVMYLMLTGQRPFDAGSELESMVRAQRADYRPPEELNPYLSREATAIVTRAMQREPAARYQTADQMLIDVERVLRGQYHSAGQTELKVWLAELARRDGAVPMGRPPAADTAQPVFVDEAGDLSAGTSVELSDIDGTAAATVVSLLPNGQAPLSANQFSLTTPVSAPMTVASPPVAALPRAPARPVVPAAPAVSAPALASGAAQPAPAVATLVEPVAGQVGGVPAPAAVIPAGTGQEVPPPSRPTVANRRMPRRGRVGLGFLLGAACMLGAVFGIKWLAQWAGRENITVSRWVPLSRDAVPGAASPTRPPAAEMGVGNPRTPALDEGRASGPGAEPAAPPTEPASVAITQPQKATADASTAASADAQGPAVVAAAAGELDDDEDRLLGRVVPDASAVIGEDEAEESGAAKPGQGGATIETKAADKVSGKAAEKASGAVEKVRSSSSARAQAKPSARAQPVQIRITTSPLGAVVRTKKQVLGRTPLAVRFNPGNTYELTFVKSGYVTNRRRLAVAIGRPQSISVAMKKAPPPRRGSFFRGR